MIADESKILGEVNLKIESYEHGEKSIERINEIFGPINENALMNALMNALEDREIELGKLLREKERYVRKIRGFEEKIANVE